MLVSLVLSVNDPAGILPSIMLAISSLPRQLIPLIGGAEGSYIIHWLCSCAPVLVSSVPFAGFAYSSDLLRPGLDPEILILIYPLHQSLCATLRYLTTTSLLTAELQLLSVALINLLLLASSPQTLILKVLLWGGGVSMLVTCRYALKWSVALARVPKWRFRRAESLKKKHHTKRGLRLRTTLASILGGEILDSESSDEDVVPRLPTRRRAASASKPPNHISYNRAQDDVRSYKCSTLRGEILSRTQTLPAANGSTVGSVRPLPTAPRKRSSTIPTRSPQASSDERRATRKQKFSAFSVKSLSKLTQSQATRRKWLYAVYVYICVLIIVLGGIREYIRKVALNGNEPVGWALGYMFGDIPWFRMEVITSGLQQWICLPARSGLEHVESCHLGWVQHLRHSSFGEANTRLIISAYWLGVIIVGLTIVLRLSSIYEVDTRRKVFHFMMVAMLLPAIYVDPTYAALALILMLAIFLLLDLFRASQLPPLSRSLAYFLAPYVDGRDLKGPVVISHIFLLIGCAIPLWLSLGALPRSGQDQLVGWEVPTREVSMVSGVICVGIGDAAASLIGRRFGRHKWLWGGGKSIEGSIAFATAVGLALVLAKAWLRFGGWPANNADTWALTAGKSCIAAIVGSLTEAVLTGGNDNVVVPIMLWLCVKGLDI